MVFMEKKNLFNKYLQKKVVNKKRSYYQKQTVDKKSRYFQKKVKRR